MICLLIRLAVSSEADAGASPRARQASEPAQPSQPDSAPSHNLCLPVTRRVVRALFATSPRENGRMEAICQARQPRMITRPEGQIEVIRWRHAVTVSGDLPAAQAVCGYKYDPTISTWVLSGSSISIRAARSAGP